MKPKPLASLNHFTVPVVRMFLPLDDVVLCSECGNAVLTDTTLFVNDALTMGSTAAVDGQITNEKRTLALSPGPFYSLGTIPCKQSMCRRAKCKGRFGLVNSELRRAGLWAAIGGLAHSKELGSDEPTSLFQLRALSSSF